MTTISQTKTMFTISIVERETGLSKDILRIWERRYGFPDPVRDPTGDRLYPRSQINRLRLIKRLIDSGMRPGKVVPQSEHKLLELAQVCGQTLTPASDGHDLERYMTLIKQHQADGLKRVLNQQLVRLGVQQFVTEIIAPLNVMVGEAWMRGDLAIFEEHFYSETALVILRNAINTLQVEALPPRVLLTTFPNEQHGLGLVMVESILSAESAQCISMGIQMPVSDIAASAIAHRCDIVALSFSGAYPFQMIGRGLKDVKALLPQDVSLWAGGAGAESAKLDLDGVEFFRTLPAIIEALHRWRTKHPQAVADNITQEKTDRSAA